MDKKQINKVEKAYFRKRLQNNFFEAILKAYNEKKKTENLTKKDLAVLLDKDPAIITRILSHPSNLTLETISDVLFALEVHLSTISTISIKPVKLRHNHCHPVAAQCLHKKGTTFTVVRSSETEYFPYKASNIFRHAG